MCITDSYGVLLLNGTQIAPDDCVRLRSIFFIHSFRLKAFVNVKTHHYCTYSCSPYCYFIDSNSLQAECLTKAYAVLRLWYQVRRCT